MPAHRIAPQADRRHATLPTHISRLALAAVEPAAAPALRNGEDHIAVPAGNGRVRENAATGGGNGMPHVWSIGGKEFVEEQSRRCRIVADGDSGAVGESHAKAVSWRCSFRKRAGKQSLPLQSTAPVNSGCGVRLLTSY